MSKIIAMRVSDRTSERYRKKYVNLTKTEGHDSLLTEMMDARDALDAQNRSQTAQERSGRAGKGGR